MVSLWDHRKKLLETKTGSASAEKAPVLASIFSVSSEVKIAGSAEAPQGPTRRRSRNKHEKDKARQDTRDERKQLFQEAFHDNIDSIGEVDAVTGSETLDINPGDVLRDPKLRLPYVHPCLNQS